LPEKLIWYYTLKNTLLLALMESKNSKGDLKIKNEKSKLRKKLRIHFVTLIFA
jgi:hypothetical protein